MSGFGKAFDRVSRAKLIKKLADYRINCRLLRLLLIKWYLSNRFQFVEVNGATSSDPSVTSGVPQELVPGSVLFLVYINDIIKNVDPCITVGLFVEYCLIYTLVRGQQDPIILNAALGTIETWHEKWNMKTNKEKALLLRITSKRTKCMFMCSIGTDPLAEALEISTTNH